MTKGYSGRSGLPRPGMYRLEKCLGGMKGYGPNQNGSGMMYAIIGIGYAGNPKEMAKGLQQCMSALDQYLTKLLGNYENNPKRYKGLTSAEGFYKPFDRQMDKKHSTCEICGAPTFKGINRCSICSSIMDMY